jgi:hypothetical protein
LLNFLDVRSFYIIPKIKNLTLALVCPVLQVRNSKLERVLQGLLKASSQTEMETGYGLSLREESKAASTLEN